MNDNGMTILFMSQELQLFCRVFLRIPLSPPQSCQFSVIQDKSMRYKKGRIHEQTSWIRPFHNSINTVYPRVMVPSHVLTLAGIAVPVNHVEVTFLVSV